MFSCSESLPDFSPSHSRCWVWVSHIVYRCPPQWSIAVNTKCSAVVKFLRILKGRFAQSIHNNWSFNDCFSLSCQVQHNQPHAVWPYPSSAAEPSEGERLGVRHREHPQSRHLSPATPQTLRRVHHQPGQGQLHGWERERDGWMDGWLDRYTVYIRI